MYSRTKTKIEHSTLSQIVASAFGPDRHLAQSRELTDGYFNAAYLLELDDGQRAVLKAAPPADVRVMRYEHGLMRAEAEAMGLAHARTSAPVPAVLAFDTSRTLLGQDYLIMSFVPGTPLNKIKAELSPEAVAGVDRQVGSFLAQMHRIAGPGFGPMTGVPAPMATWGAAFYAMMDDILTDGEEMGVALPRPAADIRALVERHAPLLDAVRTPSLVHWDLWDGNIFYDQGQVTGLIDFERAMWADPLIENQFFGHAESDAFAEGYGARLLSDEAAHARRDLYDIHLLLILIIEPAFRQYEDNGLELWAREQIDGVFTRMGV